jgi:hypothetical protein
MDSLKRTVPAESIAFAYNEEMIPSATLIIITVSRKKKRNRIRAVPSSIIDFVRSHHWVNLCPRPGETQNGVGVNPSGNGLRGSRAGLRADGEAGRGEWGVENLKIKKRKSLRRYAERLRIGKKLGEYTRAMTIRRVH